MNNVAILGLIVPCAVLLNFGFWAMRIIGGYLNMYMEHRGDPFRSEILDTAFNDMVSLPGFYFLEYLWTKNGIIELCPWLLTATIGAGIIIMIKHIRYRSR
jgi:hypothetical protein